MNYYIMKRISSGSSAVRGISGILNDRRIRT